MRRAPVVLLTVALTTTIAFSAAAQTAGTLSGTVRDSAGMPIAHADIRALTQNVATSTDADGRFVLEGLEPAWHRVLFRRLGYNRVEAEYEIKRAGVKHVDVVLAALTDTLAPVVVAARRWTGVFGTVGNVALQPLAGARVEVMGSTRHLSITDSAGRFSLPELRPGNHILLIRSQGFYPVQRSIVLPAGESRELSLFLGPLPAKWADNQRRSALGSRACEPRSWRQWRFMAGSFVGRCRVCGGRAATTMEPRRRHASAPSGSGCARTIRSSRPPAPGAGRPPVAGTISPLR